MPKKSNPAAYVHRVMTEQGFSFQDVSDRARKRGYEISRGYINNILQGRVDNPGIKTIRALAFGLNRPLEEVLAAFGLHVTRPTSGQTEVKVIYIPVAPEPVKKRQIGFISEKKPTKK